MVTHVINFRAPGTKLKVECRIYPSQREMLRAIRKDRIGGIANDTMAYCATQRARMPAGKAAIIYFSKTHLTRGIVAHEMIHATLAILARQKVRSVPCTTEDAPDVEERLAGLAGDLVDEFYKRYGL